MSLIKCPECGKTVSDQAEHCIHCGYPLSQNNKKYVQYMTINGTRYDVTNLQKSIDNYYNHREQKLSWRENVIVPLFNFVLEHGYTDWDCGQIVDHIYNTHKLPESVHMRTLEEYRQKRMKPKCPKCGSKSIEATTRGFGFFTGFLGSGKTMNYCKNCGHKWYPSMR